jgi:hypothetical protein
VCPRFVQPSLSFKSPQRTDVIPFTCHIILENYQIIDRRICFCSFPQHYQSASRSIIPVERIQRYILLIRSKKVILDRDLATMYSVTTSNLNKAVTRNIERFPEDFMFRLTKTEFNNLKFHFGTSSWGGTRKLPRAFTGQGVAMLSSVLRSKRAVAVNIVIMRTFVKLREMLAPFKGMEKKLAQLDKKLQRHDKQIVSIVEAIKLLMKRPEEKKKEPFGFHSKKAGKKK